MTSEKLDLSHLSVSEAERHVGYLLRQALSATDLGALVLKDEAGGLLFLNAAIFLSRIETEELIRLLLDSGIGEEQVISLVADLEELADDADEED